MQNTVESALQTFFERAAQTHTIEPIVFEADWPSACYQEAGDAGDLLEWKPVPQSGITDYEVLEDALELALHKDFKAYFSSFWSLGWRAKAEQGECELLFVWNEEDFDRLKENIIGHVMMKRRLRQPVTLFFALTDDENFILSVDNETGEVVLEPVGKPATQVIASNLATFIEGLTPIAPIE